MGEFGLKRGKVDLRSAGPITFGPDGILFLADNAAAKVFAVDVADPGRRGRAEPFDLADVDVRVGSFLGCDAGDVVIRDMAVHPVSHNVYLSVQRGHGDAAQPVLVRIGRLDGSITDVPLDDVPFAAAAIDDAPAADDERLDVTLPLGDEGEEVSFGDADDPHLRQPIRTVDRHRHGLRRRRAAGRRAVERGVLLEAAAHPVPVRRRAPPTATWRSSTSRTASGRPRPRSAPSCPMTAARASWPATPARRSCTSRWPT